MSQNILCKAYDTNSDAWLFEMLITGIRKHGAIAAKEAGFAHW
jgi:hypothetical protein